MKPSAFKWKLTGAFGALYLIWGSTYLAIRFALETLPPFTMSGARFAVAGLILYGWARLRGVASPAPRYWPPALLIGVLLLFLGNGGVVWAERCHLEGRRPSWIVAAGLILGFFGTSHTVCSLVLARDVRFRLGSRGVRLARIGCMGGWIAVRTTR
jgi:EamA-like transporter family